MKQTEASRGHRRPAISPSFYDRPGGDDSASNKDGRRRGARSVSKSPPRDGGVFVLRMGGSNENRGRQGVADHVASNAAPPARTRKVSSGPSARVAILAQPKKRVVEVVSEIAGGGGDGGGGGGAVGDTTGGAKHLVRKFVAFGRALPKDETTPSPPRLGSRRRSASPLAVSSGGYAALAARRSASAKGLADSREDRGDARGVDDILRWRLDSSESGSPAERFANSLRMSSSSGAVPSRGRHSPREQTMSPSSADPGSNSQPHHSNRRPLPLVSVRSPPEALASPLQGVLERVARALQGTPGILAGENPEFSPRGGASASGSGDLGIPREGQEALLALLELAKAHAAK